MKVETRNAAEVLSGFVWKNANMINKFELIGNSILINQDTQLKYLMEFQKFLIEKENYDAQVEINLAKQHEINQ